MTSHEIYKFKLLTVQSMEHLISIVSALPVVPIAVSGTRVVENIQLASRISLTAAKNNAVDKRIVEY